MPVPVVLTVHQRVQLLEIVERERESAEAAHASFDLRRELAELAERVRVLPTWEDRGVGAGDPRRDHDLAGRLIRARVALREIATGSLDAIAASAYAQSALEATAGVHIRRSA